MRRLVHAVARSLAVLVVVLAAAACGQNPVLGAWDIDAQENTRSALAAAEATDLTALTFRRDAIVAEGTVIRVSYVIEEGRVRLVREDGRGEHLIELLADDHIRIELPIGISAVYRRRGG
ncbi:MAG: hypothetical protein JRG76_16820 [Deltaproteobacteria bacterium]|nr:hypothetical protein [Deltaproteobacteria bacterium]